MVRNVRAKVAGVARHEQRAIVDLHDLGARYRKDVHPGGDPRAVAAPEVAAPRATPLELTLLDADGVPLRGRGAALGPALAPEVLRVAAPQEIRQRQAALAAEQAALDPGESRRFAAIFAAVPDAASKLRVRLLGE